MKITKKCIENKAMNYSDIEYLITKANKLGAQGQRVLNIVLPKTATLSVKDSIFIVDHPIQETATNTPWYMQ